VLAKWAARWSPLADDAAAGLGEILGQSTGLAASEVAGRASAAREEFLAGLLDPPAGGEVQAG
jgi:toluene monooxygenase system protein E